MTNAFWNGVGVRGPLWKSSDWDAAYEAYKYAPLCGTEQSYFLLQALGLASLELESLAISPVHWQTLDHASSIKESLRKLKHLALTLVEYQKWTRTAKVLTLDTHELRQSQSTRLGHLRNLVTAAPELETPAIHFRTSPYEWYVPLKILRGCRWPCLKEFALARVECSEILLAKVLRSACWYTGDHIPLSNAIVEWRLDIAITQTSFYVQIEACYDCRVVEKSYHLWYTNEDSDENARYPTRGTGEGSLQVLDERARSRFGSLRGG
jgi:hypothetical protein